MDDRFPPLSFRFLSRRLIPEIMRIERASYAKPWTDKEMSQVLASPEHFGAGAFEGERMVGYVIWAATDTKITIHNLAVDPERRRIGIGRELVDRVKEKVLVTKTRTRVELAVSELNLPAQLFFREAGFRAVRIDRNYHKGGSDAFRMVWRRPSDS